MKAPNIYLLVKSLTRIEYKHCKVELNNIKSAKKLEGLFDFTYSVADEEEFYKQKQNLPANTLKYFPQYSLKLTNLILKVLRYQEIKLGIEKLLITYINNVILLYDKRLFDFATQYVAKSYALIKKHELLTYLPVVRRLELKLNSEYRENGDGKSLQTSIRYLEESYKYTLMDYKLSKLSTEYLDHSFRKKLSVKDIDEEIGWINKLAAGLDTDSVSKYFTSNIKYQWMLAYQAMNKQNWELAKSKFNKIVELFNENELLNAADIELYWASLNNLSQVMIANNKDFAELSKVKELIEQCAETYAKSLPRSITKYKVFLSHTNLLNIYNVKGEIGLAKPLIRYIKKSIKSSRNHEIIRLNPNTFYHLTYHYFIKRDYDSALIWNNKVYESVDQKKESRFYFIARIFELLIHAETGNYSLVTNLLRSFNRGKSAVYRDKEVDEIFCKVLLSTAQSSENKISRDILKGMVEKLQGISINQYYYYYDCFDLLAWVTSKLKGKSFELTLIEMAK